MEVDEYHKTYNEGEIREMMTRSEAVTAADNENYFRQLKKIGRSDAEIKSRLHYHRGHACINHGCNFQKAHILAKKSRPSVSGEEPQPEVPMSDYIETLGNFFETMKFVNPLKENQSGPFFGDCSNAKEINHPPKGWINPYLITEEQPLQLPDFNKSKWKHCFEEFYYSEIVSTKKSTKKAVVSSEPETNTVPDLSLAAPADQDLQCPECFAMLKPTEIMSHCQEHVWKTDGHPYGSDQVFNLCGHCFTVKSSRLDLMKHHFMVKNKVTRFCCMICNICFLNEDQRIEHVRQLHTQHCMPYLCPVCPYRCSTVHQIENHLKSIHPDSVVCPFCLKVFYYVENYLRATFISDTDRIKAKDFIFNVFIDHFQQHYSFSKLYSCNRCQLTFTNKKDLKAHGNNGHSLDAAKKIPPGWHQVLLKLSPDFKSTVQKYKHRSKLADYLENYIIDLNQEDKLTEENQDLILLKFLCDTEKLLDKQNTESEDQIEVRRKYAKVIPTSAISSNLPTGSEDESENDFSDCFITDDVFLKKPTANADKFICEECLEPCSKRAPKKPTHYSAEPFECDFPDCFFRTTCYLATEMHNHEAMGTRKEPRVLFDSKWTSLNPKNYLWICTNCLVYFTDIKALAFHVHEKGHIAFHAPLESADETAMQTEAAGTSSGTMTTSSQPVKTQVRPD